MTVRRDLEVLASQGLVDKVHGGATAPGRTSTDEPGFEAKSVRERAEKDAIARVAAAPGAARAAPSACPPARRPGRWRASCSTCPASPSSPTRCRSPTSSTSAPRPDQTVVLTGGVRTPSDALVGPVAVATLRSLQPRHRVPRRARHGRPHRLHHARTCSRPRPTGRSAQSARRLVVRRRPHQVGRGRHQHDRAAGRGRRPRHRRRCWTPRPRRCSASTSARSCWPSRHSTLAGDALVRRTSTQLADGRELIYFDATRRRPPRTATRRRPARPRPTATSSEIRYDAVLDEWVAIASHRQGRTHLPPTDECPLCPSTRRPADRDPGRRLRRRRVREPLPVASPRTAGAGAAAPASRSRRRPGVGRCEVVCFTTDHDAVVRASCRRSGSALVVDAWADRTAALAAAARASSRSSASRTAARRSASRCTTRTARSTPTRSSRRAPRTHARRRPRATASAPGATCSPTCWPPSGATGRGSSTSSEHWMAFVPSAARWPVEVHLYPHRQVPDLPGADRRRARRLRRASTSTCCAASTACSTPRCRTSRPGTRRRSASTATWPTCTCEVFSIRRAPDKLKYLAGSESGMGAFINDIAPGAGRGHAARARLQR